MGAEHKATIVGPLAHHMVHKKHVKLYGSYARNYIFQLTSELSSRDVCFTFSLDM